MSEVVVMPEERTERIDLSRRMLVRVGYQDILDAVLFRGNRLPNYVRVLDGPGLPDDVVILSVHEDVWSRSFVFSIQHDSFGVVPEGMPAPQWNHPVGFMWKAVELKEQK